MNTGRFRSTLEIIINEFQDLQILDLLNHLHVSFKNAIRQPDTETTLVFKDSFSKLSNALNKAPSNAVSPIRRMILDEINATPNIGMGLLNRITKIISADKVTPVSAEPLIQKTLAEVRAFHENVVNIINSFSKLKIDHDELKEGDFEIATSLPQGLADSNLERLEQEVHELDRCLKTFNEIASGDTKSINVKILSSSDWQFFLGCLPEVAACFALAIERIVALYKNHLEIRKLKLELAEKKAPEKVMEPLKEYLQEFVQEELRKIAEGLVNEFYKGADTGRRNELNNAAVNAVKYLTDRMDHGAIFQAEAKEPKEPRAKNAEEKKSQEFRNQVQEFQKIKELANRVNQIGRAVAILSKQDRPTHILSAKSGIDDNG